MLRAKAFEAYIFQSDIIISKIHLILFDNSFLVAIASNLPILVAPNTTKKARIRSHDAEFHNFSYYTCTLLFNSAAPVSQAIYQICGGERGDGVRCWVVLGGGVGWGVSVFQLKGSQIWTDWKPNIFQPSDQTVSKQSSRSGPHNSNNIVVLSHLLKQNWGLFFQLPLATLYYTRNPAYRQDFFLLTTQDHF